MPYIKPEKRGQFDQQLMRLLEVLNGVDVGDRPGCLNYVISVLARNCAEGNYATKNEVMGVLECVKLELYRIEVGPYENVKLNAFGDVPTLAELKERLG